MRFEPRTPVPLSTINLSKSMTSGHQTIPIFGPVLGLKWQRKKPVALSNARGPRRPPLIGALCSLIASLIVSSIFGFIFCQPALGAESSLLALTLPPRQAHGTDAAVLEEDLEVFTQHVQATLSLLEGCSHAVRARALEDKRTILLLTPKGDCEDQIRLSLRALVPQLSIEDLEPLLFIASPRQEDQKQLQLSSKRSAAPEDSLRPIFEVMNQFASAVSWAERCRLLNSFLDAIYSPFGLRFLDPVHWWSSHLSASGDRTEAQRDTYGRKVFTFLIQLKQLSEFITARIDPSSSSRTQEDRYLLRHLFQRGLFVLHSLGTPLSQAMVLRLSPELDFAGEPLFDQTLQRYDGSRGFSSFSETYAKTYLIWMQKALDSTSHFFSKAQEEQHLLVSTTTWRQFTRDFELNHLADNQRLAPAIGASESSTWNPWGIPGTGFEPGLFPAFLFALGNAEEQRPQAGSEDIFPRHRLIKSLADFLELKRPWLSRMQLLRNASLGASATHDFFVPLPIVAFLDQIISFPRSVLSPFSGRNEDQRSRFSLATYIESVNKLFETLARPRQAALSKARYGVRTPAFFIWDLMVAEMELKWIDEILKLTQDLSTQEMAVLRTQFQDKSRSIHEFGREIGSLLRWSSATCQTQLLLGPGEAKTNP